MLEVATESAAEERAHSSDRAPLKKDELVPHLETNLELS